MFRDYASEFAYELGAQDVVSEGREALEKYGSGLLVADDGGVVGCVAFEPWGEGRCRMKRMFVPEVHRGRGIGRRLAEAIMVHASAAGFREMVLDTSGPMVAATALYRSLGFEPFEPDYTAPCNEVLYFRRAL